MPYAPRPLSTDPFTVLGLPHTVAAADARRAFRRAARRTHPDRYPDAEGSAFRAARQAYDALRSDLDGCRRRYRPAPLPAAGLCRGPGQRQPGSSATGARGNGP